MFNLKDKKYNYCSYFRPILHLISKDFLSSYSKFICKQTHNNPLQRSTPEMTKDWSVHVIPSTAETSALISDECFILWTDLRRLPHFNIGSISSHDCSSEPFDWWVTASEHKPVFVFLSFKAPPRDTVFVFPGSCLWHVYSRSPVRFSLLPNWRLNLLHWFVDMHARYLTLWLIRLSQWPYLRAFRGLISVVRGMKIEQSNHTFNNTYSSL